MRRRTCARRRGRPRSCANAPRRAGTSTRPKSQHGERAPRRRLRSLAALPLVVVVVVNLLMSLVVLPRLDTAYLAEARWGGIVAGGGRRRLVGGGGAGRGHRRAGRAELAAPAVRARRRMDAGANAVGAAGARRRQPGRLRRRGRRACRPSRWCATGCSASTAARWSRSRVATNILAALTGSASGGLTIALDALGRTYLQLAATTGIDPALMHRVAVIGAGTLDSLPHNGAVVTLLAVCGSTHARELFRHRHGRHRRGAAGAGRRDRPRQPVRLVLNARQGDGETWRIGPGLTQSWRRRTA